MGLCRALPGVAHGARTISRFFRRARVRAFRPSGASSRHRALCRRRSLRRVKTWPC